MIKKLKDKIKAWWKRNIVAPVPTGQEDMFDEWNPNQNKDKKKINKNFEINKYGDDDFATPIKYKESEPLEENDPTPIRPTIISKGAIKII